MSRWQHKKKSGEAAETAEVTAWLEAVGEQVDQNLADRAVERGVNVYRHTRGADQPERPRSLDVRDPLADRS